MKTKFKYILLLASLTFCISSCSKKDDNDNGTCSDGIQNQEETGVDCGGPCPSCEQPPTVTTGTISTITGTSAKCTGTVTSNGTQALIACGVCWSTSSNPTVADPHTTDTISQIDSRLSHLNMNTTYYVRAYATNGVGTSYGGEVSFTTASVLSFGDFYEGGIVFYLDASQWHGYVCAETNQNAGNSWGCSNTNVSGATGTAIGTGWANTEAIRLAGCANGYAAQACYDLVLNGYSDWFLPSQDELHAIAVNLAQNGIGNFNFFGASFWSSTNTSTTTASEVVMPAGFNQNSFKTNTLSVRAVRAF